MSSELRDRVLGVDAATSQHLQTHRRELHAAPELAFKENETATYLVERLEALSADRLQSGIAGTGIVADIKGARPGRAVMVRADMDGLPITEARDLPFRSTRRRKPRAPWPPIATNFTAWCALSSSRQRRSPAGPGR